MIPAFDQVWAKAGTKPNKLYSDRGLEFRAKKMMDYFEENDIIKYVVYSDDVHAAVAERAIRTIKNRLYKYFTKNKTTKWIDVIDKIVDGINNSVNRSTGVTPNSVNYDNARELLKKVYKDPENVKSPKYKVGDVVRIDKHKGDFPKGYLPNYTEELFRIDKVKHSDPPHYKLVDLRGEEILGVFYNENLSHTNINPNARVSEIIDERTRNGLKEYKVRWIGENKDEWIKLDRERTII
jgi:hypothetical protein